MTRTTIALLLALGACACASAPPAPPASPEPSFEQKVSWILRLEDSRTLRDPQPEPPPALPVPQGGGRRVLVQPEPPPVPDLVRMLSDREARIRRRAALAIGRVGLPEGVAPLVPVLADSDPEVRQMAAFAMGLIGDAAAKEPLLGALNDPAPVVKGSAAEALGRLGDASAASAIGRMVGELAASEAFAQTPSDDLDAARDTPQAAFRLGVSALVRLKAYDPLATAVLDPDGVPRVRWWPVAYAFQRLEDPRGLQALLALARETHPYTRAFAAKGLGAINERAAGAALLPMATAPERLVAIEAIRSLGRLREAAAAPVLLKIAQGSREHAHLRLEAVLALGSIKADGVYDTLLDLLGDRNPTIRAAAIRALARQDPEGFVTVLSGLDPDPHWSVRSALASVLGDL